MKVSLCGRLQVREYTDNTNQRKWSTEVVAEEVTFAESRAAYEARIGNQGGGYGQSDNYNAPSQRNQSDQPSYDPPEGFSAITQSIDDDDLPF